MNLRTVATLGLLAPLDLLVAFTIVIADLLSAPLRFKRREPASLPPPSLTSVTIQILNWDGKALLEESLPLVMDAVRAAGGQHEVLVVDNGSTDGSQEFLRSRFPDVRVLELDRNYGFSPGNNLGFKQVHTDIVVLLNNDMLVDRDFLRPLIAPFADPAVFGVSSRIQMADPARRKEETGKTRAKFRRGFFYLWHDEIGPEDDTRPTVPVFWAGGGSSAFDRRKLQMAGELDSLYHPFYVEDVDLSYQAWKRGWWSFIAPASRVVHKHRGTSRPRFGDSFVDNTIRRNQFLFLWKNLTDVGMMLEHLKSLPRIHAATIFHYGAAFEMRAYFRACLRLPLAIRRRIANLPAYTASDRDVLKFQK